MQTPTEDFNSPKEHRYTAEELRKYDGSNPDLPIYVAIKGTIFDVTHKRDVYGPGKSYGVFSGKDASKGLGMSSLKPEHAIADYSDLDEKDRKVLDDWYSFFTLLGKWSILPVRRQTSRSSRSSFALVLCFSPLCYICHVVWRWNRTSWQRGHRIDPICAARPSALGVDQGEGVMIVQEGGTIIFQREGSMLSGSREPMPNHI